MHPVNRFGNLDRSQYRNEQYRNEQYRNEQYRNEQCPTSSAQKEQGRSPRARDREVGRRL
jgi:hypothetical protein